MIFIPIAFGAVVLSALGWTLFKNRSTLLPNSTVKSTSSLSKGIMSTLPPNPNDMVEVKLGDETWLVARDYIGPIGIGEAADLAKANGMQLPTPALVDAIWRQADLKLLPMPRQNIVSQAVFDDQKRKIQEQIGGRDFTLMGGAFKDIVVGGDGFPQLYGWHVDTESGKTVPGIPLLKPITTGPGKIIQPLSGHAHGLFFKDYSQGLRMVKKKADNV